MNSKELKELIEFLIEKDIAEFELERGDVKVRIKRAGEHTVVHSHAEETLPFGITGVPFKPVIHVAGTMGPEAPVWDIADKFGDNTNLLVTNVEQHISEDHPDLVGKYSREQILEMAHEH